MPRPPPQPLALALVVAHFISQFRIAQCRQRIRRDKLSFPRRKSLRIPCPPVVPLVRHSARLVDRRRKHSLDVRLRSSQRLPQINLFSLFSSRGNQRPVPAHILTGDPPRLPVPRLLEARRSHVPSHDDRICTLLFLLTLSRRIRKLFPRALSRVLRRGLRRLLRPRAARTQNTK